MSHRGLRLQAPLLAELHHPPAQLVGHVDRGPLVVHVDHVDAGPVEVPVEVRERGRATAEAVALEIQEYKYKYKIKKYKIQIIQNIDRVREGRWWKWECRRFRAKSLQR